jgi:hypothetical protein
MDSGTAKKDVVDKLGSGEGPDDGNVEDSSDKGLSKKAVEGSEQESVEKVQVLSPAIAQNTFKQYDEINFYFFGRKCSLPEQKGISGDIIHKPPFCRSIQKL